MMAFRQVNEIDNPLEKVFGYLNYTIFDIKLENIR